MTTFIVHMPATDTYRLAMFGKTAVQVMPAPQVVSLKSDREVVMIRASFRTIGKMAKMFPEWQFQAMLA
ncbi:MAG: hypothetical protein ACO1OG_00900 [Devosia sp.]